MTVYGAKKYSEGDMVCRNLPEYQELASDMVAYAPPLSNVGKTVEKLRRVCLSEPESPAERAYAERRKGELGAVLHPLYQQAMEAKALLPTMAWVKKFWGPGVSQAFLQVAGETPDFLDDQTRDSSDGVRRVAAAGAALIQVGASLPAGVRNMVGEVVDEAPHGLGRTLAKAGEVFVSGFVEGAQDVGSQIEKAGDQVTGDDPFWDTMYTTSTAAMGALLLVGMKKVVTGGGRIAAEAPNAARVLVDAATGEQFVVAGAVDGAAVAGGVVEVMVGNLLMASNEETMRRGEYRPRQATSASAPSAKTPAKPKPTSFNKSAQGRNVQLNTNGNTVIDHGTNLSIESFKSGFRLYVPRESIAGYASASNLGGYVLRGGRQHTFALGREGQINGIVQYMLLEPGDQIFFGKKGTPKLVGTVE